MEAGFMRVVEVEQYFMTKDTGDFRQFRAVACREHTLHRDDPASQPRGWIQGNTRIGLVLEVTTSYMHGKHGIEMRICSVSQDNCARRGTEKSICSGSLCSLSLGSIGKKNTFCLLLES